MGFWRALEFTSVRQEPRDQVLSTQTYPDVHHSS
jgi:hypothetical protein